MKKFLVAAAFSALAFTASFAQNTISSSEVGPLKIGMKFKDVPKSVPGLYSEVVAFEDEGGMDLMNGDTVVMSVYGDNTVESIALSKDGTGFATADGVKIGMSAKDFFTIPGWTEVISDNALGQYYTKDGVTAIISFDLTPDGMSNYEKGGTIRKQDFAPDAAIESIMVGNFDMED